MKVLWIFSLIVFVTLTVNGYPSLPGEGETNQLKPSENIYKALKQLGIADSACHFGLVAEKVIPYSPSQSVIVIPKLIEKDEDIFVCDLYLVIVDNKTGSVVNKYHESEALVSDAIRIQSISIDFAPFKLNATTRAFGIRVLYEGDSRPNPYEREDISLFIPKGDKLINILKNYAISSITGEWDTNCEGQFVSEKKILIMANKVTNMYFDIIVKQEVTTTKNTMVDGECKDTDTVDHHTSILKFDNSTYK